jgi:hypothetical protein
MEPLWFVLKVMRMAKSWLYSVWAGLDTHLLVCHYDNFVRASDSCIYTLVHALILEGWGGGDV